MYSLYFQLCLLYCPIRKLSQGKLGSLFPRERKGIGEGADGYSQCEYIWNETLENPAGRTARDGSPPHPAQQAQQSDQNYYYTSVGPAQQSQSSDQNDYTQKSKPQ